MVQVIAFFAVGLAVGIVLGWTMHEKKVGSNQKVDMNLDRSWNIAKEIDNKK